MTTGPIIMEKVKDKGIKYHSLASIGVRLDDRFEPYEMAILEELTQLPEGFTVEEEADTYELYTALVKDEESKKWIMTQSVGSEPVGEEKSYTDETLPFQYFGWAIAKGDTYHRPYCEQLMGDIRSLNNLAQVLTEGAVIASKSLLFVDPRGGRTRMKDVATSANGAIIEGRADDVTAFQLQKNFDFKVPMERLGELRASLEKAFLVNQSAGRQAERVTATEIQYMAQDLETQLAGIYSIMASKISKRIITWLMQEMGIKFDAVEVNIITGLDSLSKRSEAQTMDAYMQTLAQFEMLSTLKPDEVIQRYANYYGINTLGLFKTPQEMQQEQEAAQKAQMMAEGGSALAQAAGTGAGQALTGQGKSQAGGQQ